MILRYDNLDSNNPKEIDWDFGRSGLKKKNITASPLHSIASYLAMFSPSLPEYFIENYSKEGDLIMDPFSGRGTTALRAREKGRRFIGYDLNPYALVLSKFKISQVTLKDILLRIKIIEDKYYAWIETHRFIHLRKEYKDLRIYYAPQMLKSLIFIRDFLGKKWRSLNEVDNAILAFACGIMHGPSKKDGSSIFFSLSMSNSISMSPNYVRKFAQEHNLKRQRGTLFPKLITRVKEKFDDILTKENDAHIFEHDATMVNEEITNSTVDLVITSPPYLNIVNYTNSNWLKLWLLGYDREKINERIKLTDKLAYNEYINFISSVLKALEPKIRMGGHVCLIVGDVKDKKLIEDVWNEISDSVNYEFVEIFYDNGYSQNKKVLNAMNKRKGQATIIEKILVLRRV